MFEYQNVISTILHFENIQISTRKRHPDDHHVFTCSCYLLHSTFPVFPPFKNTLDVLKEPITSSLNLKSFLAKDFVALFFNLNLECNRALLECKQMSFSRSLATKKFTQCSKIFWCFLAFKLKSKFQECTKPVVAQDVSLAIHLAYEGWLQVISAVLVSHQVQTYGILQCKY